MKYREAVVAGKFYPKDREALVHFIRRACQRDPMSTEILRTSRAIFSPHAGYIYSGNIAGEVYKRIEVPSRVVVMCPNHTGRGRRLSIWKDGVWETPLGEVKVDADFTTELLSKLHEKHDEEAHLYEHAIEVQLPFLKWKNASVQIVPIVLGPLALDRVLVFADTLSELCDENTLVVASTDMSHYISAALAKEKDHLALKFVERVDPEGLYQVVSEEDISMCGFIPTTALLEAAKKWGLKKGEVLAYGTSGDVTGDDASVVGYASGWIV